jgi:putative ABC transport system permease protein
MNGFIDSLKERLYYSARNISSGDIKIQSFQKLNPDKIQEIEKILNSKYLYSEMLVFPNMIRKENGDSFLVSIKAVDSLYPFYGTVKLFNQNFDSIKAGEGYLAKEAADRFSIKPGDKLLLGSQSILVKGLIDELPDQGFSGTSAFSPVLLIPLENARASGLLQFGSRITYMNLYKGKGAGLSQEKIEEDADTVEAKMGSEAVQVTTWKDSQNMSRSLFDRLGSYFNILSYTAVILSAIGFYLGLSAFVLKITKEGSVLYGFGVSKNRLRNCFFILFSFLVLSGCCFGLVLGLIGENYLIHQMDDLIVTTKEISFHLPLLLFTIFFCLISSGIIVTVSVKKFLKELNPLNYNLSFVPNYFSIPGFLFYIFFVFGLLALFSWYQTGVWKSSFALNGMILLLIFLLFLLIWTVIFILGIFVNPLKNQPSIYIAGIEFFRNKRQHLPGIIGLVLSSVLVLGIISARDTLKQKLTINDKNDLANVFMIDIQKSQLPEVTKFIKSNDRYRNFNYSPLVRARLNHVNHKSVEVLKEEAKQNENLKKLSFLSRSYNLTYKDSLNKSEKIIEGEFWKDGYDGLGISLEADFANSMGVKLGDTIGFDLAGIPLEGEITSIRTIDWSSLLPNFFVIFPKQKLENAPQFIIGSAKIDEQSLPTFQNQLVGQFPNISVIELGAIFKKVQILFEKVLRVLMVSSGLCVLASLAIMISTLLVSEEDASRRSFLLRSTGMNANKILLVSIIEKLLYFTSLVTTVLLLHLLWNFLMTRWMKEPIPFNIILFLIYTLTIACLIFCPLLFNRIAKIFHLEPEN